MADDHDQWAETLSAEPTAGWLTGFLAEENTFDRRMLWRLGSWGAAAVAAVIVAVLAAQSQSQARREQLASTDLLTRQSQQIQFVARETQNEARRLSQAIETLNGDRDRLFARITSVEQGLESVTGSIKRQAIAAIPVPAIAPFVGPLTLPATMSAATVEPVPHVAPPPPMPAPAPPAASVAAVAAAAPPHAETPRPSAAASLAVSAPLMAPKSIMAPPDAAATKLSEPPAPPQPTPAPETTASVRTNTPETPAPTAAAGAEPAAIPVPRTEFGVDLGGANSVDGLRALWRGVANSKELTGLRPIMIVKERSGGYGMQLRLIAGPLTDAAAAARLCAALIENRRSCATAVFDGQRLALKSEAPLEAAPARPAPRKRATPKPERITERALPPPEEPAPPPPKPPSTLTSILGIR